MDFIILRNDCGYHIETANTAVNVVKQYVEYCSCACDNKPFAVLCDSGKMTLSELIAYANQYLLPDYARIDKIYTLGQDCLAAASPISSSDSPTEETVRSLPWRTHLELSTRIYNRLAHCGATSYTLQKHLETIGDVADLPRREIIKIRGIGPLARKEIACALQNAGITHSDWFVFNKPHSSQS